jgi:hypothetical protein
VTKTEVCDNCGKLRHSGDGWQRLDWIDRPPSRLSDEQLPVRVFSEVVDSPWPKDFCSWKCILEYSLNHLKRVTGRANEVSRD